MNASLVISTRPNFLASDSLMFRALLSDFANLPAGDEAAASYFRKKWAQLPWPHKIPFFRFHKALLSLWREGPFADLDNEPITSREQFTPWIGAVFQHVPAGKARFYDWAHASIEIEVSDCALALCVAALANARYMTVCANPQCARRYFLRTKPNQRFCGPECAKVEQRSGKREWWATHGKEWRHKRQKKARAKAGQKRGGKSK
jgi:hypothetical protein